MSSQPYKSDVSPSWGVTCRPTLLFVVAFALNVTPHEVVHAITSYLLGFNSTVFQMWMNPDSAEATPRQLAIIAASGPLFSLAVGAVCWVLYQRRFRDRPSGLAFLMIAMVGIYFFLGPPCRRGPWRRLPHRFHISPYFNITRLSGVGNRLHTPAIFHVLHGKGTAAVGASRIRSR